MDIIADNVERPIKYTDYGEDIYFEGKQLAWCSAEALKVIVEGEMVYPDGRRDAARTESTYQTIDSGRYLIGVNIQTYLGSNKESASFCERL